MNSNENLNPTEDLLNNNESQPTDPVNEEPTTFSRDEVMKLIQQESDKRVSQALATQQKKFEKQLSLSKLDDNARAQQEKDDRIAELQAQLSAFQIEKNKSELKSVLASRGLSAQFADLISIDDDLEASQAKIDALDKLFKASVKAEIERRLAQTGGVPRGTATNFSGELTIEQFRAMPLAEQAKLAKERPELYKKLTTH